MGKEQGTWICSEFRENPKVGGSIIYTLLIRILTKKEYLLVNIVFVHLNFQLLVSPFCHYDDKDK